MNPKVYGYVSAGLVPLAVLFLTLSVFPFLLVPAVSYPMATLGTACLAGGIVLGGLGAHKGDGLSVAGLVVHSLLAVVSLGLVLGAVR